MQETFSSASTDSPEESSSITTATPAAPITPTAPPLSEEKGSSRVSALRPLQLGLSARLMSSSQLEATKQLWNLAQGEVDAPEEFKRLIQSSKIDIQDTVSGMTPLLLAVIKGHVNSVIMLLKAGADLNMADKEGMTPLMHAVMQNNVKIVKIFLKEELRGRIKFDLKNKKKYTAFMLAAQSKEPKIYEAFYLAFSSDFPKLESVIRPLVESGHCERLKDFPIKLSEMKISGEPLVISAAKKDHHKMVKFLIDQRVWSGIVRGKQGKTSALIEAAENGCIKTVKVLLENNGRFIKSAGGCYLNTMRMEGEWQDLPSLERTVIQKEGPIVFSWYQIRRYDSPCRTFGIARISGEQAKITHLPHRDKDNEEVSDGLTWIDKYRYEQLKVHCKDEENLMHDVQGEFFALQEAVRNGHIDVVKALLQYNPWLRNYQDLGEKPLLQLAIENGRLDILKELCEDGRRYNMYEFQSLVAQKGNIEMAKFLFQKDTQEYIQPEPIYNAAINGHADLLDFYLSKARPEILNYPCCHIGEAKPVTLLLKAYLQGKSKAVQLLISRGADQSVLNGKSPSENKEKTRKSVILMRGIAQKNVDFIEDAIEAKLEINIEHIKYAIKTIRKPENPNDEFYTSLDNTLICLIENCWGPEACTGDAYINGLKIISEFIEKEILDKLPLVLQKINAPISTLDSKNAPFILQPKGEVFFPPLPPLPQIAQHEPDEGEHENHEGAFRAQLEGESEVVSPVLPSAPRIEQSESKSDEQKKNKPSLLLEAVKQRDVDKVREVMSEKEGVPGIKWRLYPEFACAYKLAVEEEWVEIVEVLDLAPQLPVQLSQLPHLRVVGGEAALSRHSLQVNAEKPKYERSLSF